jgi:metal-responsive CopG/Arc/MetJ family transcriptional regulator
MESVAQDDKVRKYFSLSKNLSNKADKIGSELGLNFSDLIRTALEDFVGKVEKEKIDKEIAEACAYYFDIDQEIASDWKNAEGNIE